MAISTETQALIDLYNQKISLDNQQLYQVNVVQTGYTIKTGIGTTDSIKIWGPSETISNYNSPIEKLDTRIVELNSEVVNFQTQLLILGQGANFIGCGTATWSPGFTSVTVYQDELKYRGYRFTGKNPFHPIGGTLTSGNSGIGTEDYINQVAIGTYYDPVDICNDIFQFTCNNTICAGYASSITNLTNQIVSIQSTRNDLIDKVNFLKNARINSQLQNYAYNQSKSQLSASIENSNTILSFLQDPANAEWL